MKRIFSEHLAIADILEPAICQLWHEKRMTVPEAMHHIVARCDESLRAKIIENRASVDRELARRFDGNSYLI